MQVRPALGYLDPQGLVAAATEKHCFTWPVVRVNASWNLPKKHQHDGTQEIILGRPCRSYCATQHESNPTLSSGLKPTFTTRTGRGVYSCSSYWTAAVPGGTGL